MRAAAPFSPRLATEATRPSPFVAVLHKASALLMAASERRYTIMDPYASNTASDEFDAISVMLVQTPVELPGAVISGAAQSAQLVAPVAVVSSPAAHSLHELLPVVVANEPTAHELQAVQPSAEYCPAPHRVQSAKLAPPVAFRYLPAGHSEGSSAAAGQKAAAGQGVHVLPSLMLPAAHERAAACCKSNRMHSSTVIVRAQIQARVPIDRVGRHRKKKLSLFQRHACDRFCG